MSGKNWDDCLRSFDAVKITPDLGRAKSLLEIAEERINFSVKELNERNINFIFEDYYSSVIEILHSILLIEGYKVLNHICLGNYLRDVLKREDLFYIFNDLRYKRNSLIYYGKRMDFEVGKHSIVKCKNLIKELRIILNKNLNKGN